MKELIAILDAKGREVIGVNYSNYRDARVLAATVAEVHDVPAGAKFVLFNATVDFYANFGAAAAIPAADVTNGTASILNPELRSIDGAATIGLISPYAGVVTMEFYS